MISARSVTLPLSCPPRLGPAEPDVEFVVGLGGQLEAVVRVVPTSANGSSNPGRS